MTRVSSANIDNSYLERLIDAGLVKTDAWLRYVGEELPKPEHEWQTDTIDPDRK